MICNFSNCPNPCASLREYPVGFGWKLVDMYPKLTSTARGCAPLPENLPGAMASFMEMPQESDCLMFADIDDVFNYLRRNRHLKIPQHWQDLVPKPKWFQKTTWFPNLDSFFMNFWGRYWIFPLKLSNLSHFWARKCKNYLEPVFIPY